MLTKIILMASLLSNALTANAPCLALRITNGYGHDVHVASGPVNLTAEVRVRRHDEHRYIIVAWDYAQDDADQRVEFSTDDALVRDQPAEVEPHDGSIGSEERSLNGSAQQTRNDFKLQNLEGGTFVVTATIYTDESRKHAHDRASARVIVR